MTLAEIQNEAIFGDAYSGQDAYLNFDEFLPLLGGRRYKSALDIGCGNGAIACRLSHGWAGNVLGIDVSPQLVSIAQQNAFLSQTNQRVKLCLLDMDLLTSEVISAHDLIYALDTLQHSRDLGGLLHMVSNKKQSGATVAGSIWCMNDDQLAVRWGFPKAYAARDVRNLLTRAFPGVVIKDSPVFGERLVAHLRFVAAFKDRLLTELGEDPYQQRLSLLNDSLRGIDEGLFGQILFSTALPSSPVCRIGAH